MQKHTRKTPRRSLPKRPEHHLDIKDSFGGIYQGLTVLVTGHTGFKGSWLSIWLTEMGARVIGYSLDPPTMPNHFEASRLKGHVVDIRDDIRNFEKLVSVVEEFQPKVIFHLAAQPIVSESYVNPKDTFIINAGGTVNVLEAIRRTRSVRAAVFVTSDKCYRNQEWAWGYRENDPLGGGDPYSASKAMAELAVEAYRDAFWAGDMRGDHPIAVASARAGNVIGGGDWAKDRLLPDIMRALVEGRTIDVRSPQAIRPWQFVFSPLCGYMWLAVRLLLDGVRFAEPWNFGPLDLSRASVQDILQKIVKLWGSGEWRDVSKGDEFREAHWLTLSWEKAATRLGWRPVYLLPDVLAMTVEWYKEWHRRGENADMYDFGVDQIRTYVKAARKLGIRWACSQPDDRLQRTLI